MQKIKKNIFGDFERNFRKMKFTLMVCLMAILFEEKIEAKKIERNSGWASTSVLDIVEVQSKYFIKFPWYQIHYDL